MKKRILVFAGLGLLITLFIGGAFIVYRVRNVLSSFREFPKMPDDLRVAKTVQGINRFSKEVFFSQVDLGLITDIKQEPNQGLVIIGQLGAAFLDNGRTLNHSIHFEKCNSDVVSVEVGHGVFLCRGTWNTDTALFDASGKRLWSYSGGMNGIDDAAAGAIGADLSNAIVVGFNGVGGVRGVNPEGKELWKREDGNVWHVEILKADNNAGNVIVHSNSRGQLTVRNSDGTVLGRYQPDVYLASFSLTNWGKDADVDKLVAAEEGSVYVIDQRGKTLARLGAPGSAAMAEPKGTSVHLSPGKPFFAVLLRYFLWNRSLLYIYDDQNALVYREILDHDCDAVRATPGKNGTDELLLGCEGMVWKYSIADQLHAARPPGRLHPAHLVGPRSNDSGRVHKLVDRV